MSLGQRIKSERESRGWSQLFAAEKIGVSNTVLSNYERDYRDPDTETLKIIADVYETSTDYLLGTTRDRRPSQSFIVQEDKTIYKAGNPSNEDVVKLPEVQFIMRAKEKMNPKAYAKWLKLMEDAQKAFDEEDDD